MYNLKKELNTRRKACFFTMYDHDIGLKVQRSKRFFIVAGTWAKSWNGFVPRTRYKAQQQETDLKFPTQSFRLMSYSKRIESTVGCIWMATLNISFREPGLVPAKENANWSCRPEKARTVAHNKTNSSLPTHSSWIIFVTDFKRSMFLQYCLECGWLHMQRCKLCAHT